MKVERIDKTSDEEKETKTLFNYIISLMIILTNLLKSFVKSLFKPRNLLVIILIVFIIILFNSVHKESKKLKPLSEENEIEKIEDTPVEEVEDLKIVLEKPLYTMEKRGKKYLVAKGVVRNYSNKLIDMPNLKIQAFDEEEILVNERIKFFVGQKIKPRTSHKFFISIELIDGFYDFVEVNFAE